MRVTGGCHCGAVRFAAEVEPPVELLECNCSICRRTGYLHLIVADAQFDLECGREALASYRFGSGTAEHLFCRTCGIKSFYRPRSHPDGWSIDFRCLDPGHGLDPAVRRFDGAEWESAAAGLAASRI